jgi:membrane carboxypeptidase/penicillin-binding protein
LQAGLIAIEPQTGYIKAMVGGRDYYVTRQTVNFYNRAVQAKRQPGSAFKPIVLAAMFSQPSLATPATVLTDEPWFTEGKPGERWAPRNYSKRGVGVHFGDVTIRTIIEKSINVAMARLMNETPLELQTGVVEGITRTLKLAKQMGITSPLRPFPALALGASDLTLLEITSAYGSFANEGIYAKPISIQFVENRAGEILIENQVSRHRVLDQNVSYLVTHLLEGVIKNGTGRRVRTMGLTRPSAGKTGTTNDFTDAWFTGYVPNLSVGVWVGFDDPQKSADQEGAKGALPIWARFMLDGLRGEVQDFRLPAGVIFKEIDKETGLLAYEGKCSPENIVREAFLTGQEPKVLCNAHD